MFATVKFLSGFAGSNRRKLAALLLGTLWIMFLTPSAGECCLESTSSSTEVSAQQDASSKTAAAREKIKERIRILNAEIEQLGDQKIPEAVGFELDLLSWIDLTYTQLDSLAGQRESVFRGIRDLKQEQESLSRFGIDEPKPYSYLLLDDIRGELLKQRGRLSGLQARQTSLQDSLDEANTRLKETESKRRLAEETIANEPSSEDRLENQTKRDSLALQSEARTIGLEQIQKESEINQLEIEAQALSIQLLEDKEQIVAADVRFSQQDLDSRLKLLEQADLELRSELSTKLRQLACIDDDSTLEPSSKVHEQSLGELQAEIRRQEVGLIRQLLRELVEFRAAWRWRFEIANKLVSIPQLHEIANSLEDASVRIDSLANSLDVRMDELRDALLVIRKLQLENAGVSGPNPDTHQLKIVELEQATTRLNSHISLLRAGQRLLQRAMDESSASLAPANSQVFLSSLAYWAKAVWNYEIAVVDDRSLTVGKILSALGLLLGSILLARLLSRLLGTRLLPRLGVNEAGAATLQTIAFYLLICCFAFIVLDLVNVPITGFAFMGGAIAIGVGFGSQNIINNFISGLILLAERPIRPGDLVEIDGLLANVQHVGARSTRVRTGSNLEIVVPNSKLLENNVANWTLSNTRIRVSVTVGVAYGSAPEEVIDHLRAAAAEHPDVLATPEPIILFKDFGDNSLMFECHFWVHMRTMMEGEKIRSDVRCCIDRLLSEANITIAFPQRDVHIDTSRPLEINLRQVEAENYPKLVRRAA